MVEHEHDWLAERFEEHRSHLRAVAYRMLGSRAEAEDAVQEAWLRFSRSDTEAVENLAGWLTTVVGRICLDMLRTRTARREAPLDAAPDPIAHRADGSDPERDAMLADAVGPALLVVLETLSPAERLAFVLHDVFAMPFDEIAPIVGRSSDATRQLASRARRRVRGTSTDPDADRSRQRAVVDAFLAAARGGDFAGLLALLAPDAVLHGDDTAVRMGAVRGVRGAVGVAEQFSGRAHAAQLALINGAVGGVWAPKGRPVVVFAFTIEDEAIVAIDLVADRAHLDQLDVEILTGWRAAGVSPTG